MPHKPLRSTLMLVDDDPAIITLVEHIVRRHDDLEFDIVSHTDPQAASDALGQRVIDILLTDLDMPAINGVELLKIAKHRNELTQVLFLTGQSSQGALLTALEHGATDYLLKPLDRDQLVNRLREAQDRKRRWRQTLGQIWSNRRRQAAFP